MKLRRYQLLFLCSSVLHDFYHLVFNDDAAAFAECCTTIITHKTMPSLYQKNLGIFNSHIKYVERQRSKMSSFCELSSFSHLMLLQLVVVIFNNSWRCHCQHRTQFSNSNKIFSVSCVNQILLIFHISHFLFSRYRISNDTIKESTDVVLTSEQLKYKVIHTIYQL